MTILEEKSFGAILECILHYQYLFSESDNTKGTGDRGANSGLLMEIPEYHVNLNFLGRTCTAFGF